MLRSQDFRAPAAASRSYPPQSNASGESALALRQGSPRDRRGLVTLRSITIKNQQRLGLERETSTTPSTASSTDSSSDSPRSQSAEHINSLSVHRPTCDQDRFCLELTAHQDFIKGEKGTLERWYGTLPVRIGHEPCLDLACLAYLTAAHYRAGTRNVTLRTCYTASTKAIVALQARLKAPAPDGVVDSVLQTVALLAFFEASKAKHNLLQPAHLEGLVTLLASRSTNVYPASDISRSIVNYFAFDAMTLSLVKGSRSPLEWLDRSYYECPIPGRSSLDLLTRLGALRIELCIRIPRLVALLRSLKVADNKRAPLLNAKELYAGALSLAKELYRVRDNAAEWALLGRMPVSGSTQLLSVHSTQQFVPFDTPLVWESALMYWHARFCIIRLCLELAGNTRSALRAWNYDMIPTCDDNVVWRSALESELVRLGSHLLMGANVGQQRREKRDRLRAQSMISIWGAITDMPHLAASDGTVGSQALQDWLLERTVRALNAPELFFTDTDMDQAADMLVGGPNAGTYAQLYAKGTRATIQLRQVRISDTVIHVTCPE
ncbi:hypothetical protein LTR97_005316 [Elasticomyces elasticus]|uniref:Transcription factor domain-containing protein n=1 Tax=Elasticomyces elasticus TaxID=574655 RepID=A0AAN7ZNT7_9PEZI|nr:hypothetical protein LTR97_005316 [Elasticomyces elasticus]